MTFKAGTGWSLILWSAVVSVIPVFLAGITKALCNEWADKDINVNAIAPGYIATENTRPLREDEERNEAILDRIPAGRWGDPEDMQGAAVFLASEAGDYMHGHILAVDGGWLAR